MTLLKIQSVKNHQWHIKGNAYNNMMPLRHVYPNGFRMEIAQRYGNRNLRHPIDQISTGRNNIL